MKPDEFNLVWLDMEMTGLNPEQDRIIEIAVVVTDLTLQLLAEGPTIAIHQSAACLAAMDTWNQRTHKKSGLIARVSASTTTEQQAQNKVLDFLRPYVPEKKTPLCGNSICQDRRFMARHMPELEAFFHYRNVDVSTLKELCLRWRPELTKGFKKQQKHSALADILESIEEMKYYREHFLRVV